MATTFSYCLRQGFLGVGWRVESLKATKDWDLYLAEGTQVHGSLHICRYIKRWVNENDLVWTRDTGGQYYLARVVSGWEYWTCDESEEIDIGNVFRCDIRRVPLDSVPGKVVACFRAPKTIQEIACGNAREYSKHLWNVLTEQISYDIDSSVSGNIFMLLDDEETEDLIFLYLQSKGWFLVPNSRKKDTMAFEFQAVRPGSGEIAVAQVKTGNTPIYCDQYSGQPHHVFLFQSNELYHAAADLVNVTCITRSELLDFMSTSEGWLPGIFRKKLALSRQMATPRT